jgi:putative flippase GtrA
MSAEDMSTAVVELPFHHRVRIGVRKGHNWVQLMRFAGVGAYFVGTTNNFFWNRRWTFGHKKEAHAATQAWKFYAVSLLSFGVNYGVLVGLVRTTGMEKVLAQAIANAVGTPVNFLGQKLWSFRD